MDNKISNKYLKSTGWSEWIDEKNEDAGNHMGEHTYSKHEHFMIDKYDKNRSRHLRRSFARLDHFYRKTTNKWGDCKISNYYMFTAHGNNYKVETGVIYKKMDIDTLENILKLVGIK